MNTKTEDQYLADRAEQINKKYANQSVPSLLEENESLKKELEALKIAKVNESALNAIIKKPGLVSKIAANEIKKNEELEAINKQLLGLVKDAASRMNGDSESRERARYYREQISKIESKL